MTLNGEMALILRFIPNLVVSGAHCVKLVDKAITMNNLRLLSCSNRLQISIRFINLKLNVQYLAHLDTGSRI